MNNYQINASLLKMMGHPIRLKILDLLRQGETCVCHLENAIGRRQAYVSQQLMILRDAALVDSRKDGLQVYYSLANKEVCQILETLYGNREQVLDLLETCPCPSCKESFSTLQKK